MHTLRRLARGRAEEDANRSGSPTPINFSCVEPRAATSIRHSAAAAALHDMNTSTSGLGTTSQTDPSIFVDESFSSHETHHMSVTEIQCTTAPAPRRTFRRRDQGDFGYWQLRHLALRKETVTAAAPGGDDGSYALPPRLFEEHDWQDDESETFEDDDMWSGTVGAKAHATPESPRVGPPAVASEPQRY